MGRRATFSLLAGRCTPADIRSLERVRAKRLYRQISPSWRDFCTHELGCHRRKVERALHYLHEFGPRFFRVSRLAHIRATDYRLIAHHIDDEGVHFDGIVIPVRPDRRRQLADAVQELLRRVPRRCPERPAVPATLMLRRLGSAADALANLDQPLDALDRMDLAELVMRIRRLATAQGLAA
jgi:hypothetical protein